TDVTIAPGGLPDELADLAGWVACLADARPLEEYTDLLATAGLLITRTEHHDDALRRMIEQIDARVRALRMIGGAWPVLADLDVDLDGDRVAALIAQAARAVELGAAGYALLLGRKPWAEA
ncbi:methyltransferase type 11, partial [Kitasatospora sp. NPDC093558]